MEMCVKYWNYKFLALAFLLWSCRKTHHHQPNDNDQDEVNSGGTTTSFDATSKAYTFPLTNISDASLVQHILVI